MWETLKGFRTVIIAAASGAVAALFGALSLTDWGAVLHANMPAIPGWAIVILAATLGGALRSITTTPIGKKDEGK